MNTTLAPEASVVTTTSLLGSNGKAALMHSASANAGQTQASAAKPSLNFGGRVINALNGYPLPGVTVQLLFLEQSLASGGAGTTNTPLGSATAAWDGSFVIQLIDSAVVQERIQILQYLQGASVTWQVTTPEGQVSTPTAVTRKVGSQIAAILSATLPPLGVSIDQWAIAAARLTKAKMNRLHHFVNQLVLAPPTRSLFMDWPLSQRHAAASELELAFLDGTGTLRQFAPVPTFYQMSSSMTLPDYQNALGAHVQVPAVEEAFQMYAGRLQSFQSMAGVDWVMDLPSLMKGMVAGAVNANQANYQKLAGSSGPIPVASINQDAVNLVNYRDYLRSIFAGADVSAPGNMFTTYETKLENRFHQTFITSDTNSAPLNKLLIPIVTSILVAPSGATYGFGLAASAIPVQGAGQSNSDYLSQLVTLSGISATEFSLRYRLDLTQPDDVVSSPVQLNIDTLQRFYRDGFQSPSDPAPIIPAAILGRAPFFLEFEEWLTRNGAFYGENYYQIQDTVWDNFAPDDITYFQNAKTDSNADGYSKWLAQYIDLKNTLNDGHQQLSIGEYTLATQKYMQAAQMAATALQTGISAFGDGVEVPNGMSSSDVLQLISSRLAQYHAQPMNQASDLDSDAGPSVDGDFMQFLRITFFNHAAPAPGLQSSQPIAGIDMYQEMVDDHAKHVFCVLHAYLYGIPVFLGDTALAAGDPAQAQYYYGLASGFTVGVARASESAGYGYWSNGVEYVDYIQSALPSDTLFVEPDGTLPYSCDVSSNRRYSYGAGAGGAYPSQFFIDLASAIALTKTHAMERRFLYLRQGEAILEWADSLYRTNNSASIARARELYKAVMWMHDTPPPISPSWSTPMGNFYWNATVNPAITSQITRAQRCFYQIEGGLNYYGFTDDYVPALRYTTLKAAADQFASSAKGAETDYLNAIGQVENDLQQGLLTSNMLQKATLQADIASQQVDAAGIAVDQAQSQITQIKKAMQADLAAAEDADTFGTELENFFTGAVKAITSLPSAVLKGVAGGGGGAAAAGAGTDAGLFGEGGFLGMGSVGAYAGGFGLAIYAFTSGIYAAGNAASQYESDYSTLQDTALPRAYQALQVQQDQLNIANFTLQSAQADMQLAQALINFQANRTLTLEFWGKLQQVFKRTLHRYLDLGAQYAWLAQQALAYEQNRKLDVIRLDYFPSADLGISGADMLQLDLANLESVRLSGFKSAVPVKHTFSLFSDFPLQYGQLKQNGGCTFRTLETTLSNAYPGFYGFRIRAIDVAVQTASAIRAIRGTLTNYGASWLSQSDGSTTLALRFPDSLPISEYSVSKDLAVFGLPNDSLMTFEGSGFESFWSLQFSPVANPFGLDGLADILFTFDLTANYSPVLYAKQISSPPTSVERFVLVSANAQDPTQLSGLTGSSQKATITFDLTKMKLPSQESNRTIANLIVLAVNASPLTFKATLASNNPVLTAAVNAVANIAMSNEPPVVQTGTPASPLNVFAGRQVAQAFQLTIDKTANPGVDFSQVVDLMLGIDYKASLT